MNTLQERADRLVRNEVYVCLSSLVSTLAKGAFDCSTFGKTAKELDSLCEQAFELCTPILDYEEAAMQEGWSVRHDMHGYYFCNTEEAELEDSGTASVGFDGRPHYATEEACDWQELCNDESIDPYEREVFEHWSVSQHLADDLASLGERIDNDFAGMCVWGRTTTGQGIAQDSIIRRVLALHDARLAKFEQAEKVA